LFEVKDESANQQQRSKIKQVPISRFPRWKILKGILIEMKKMHIKKQKEILRRDK